MKERSIKTVLPGAITYSLISRMQKALKAEVKASLCTGETVDMIDGRGFSHKVDSGMIRCAVGLGAKILASSTTTHLKPRLSLQDGKLVINDVRRGPGRPPLKGKLDKKSQIKKIIKRRK